MLNSDHGGCDLQLRQWRWQRLVAILIVGTAGLLLNTAATSSDPSQAALSEAALFSRCYTHITQLDLPLTHSLRAQVLSGSLTAVNACIQVLNSADLNSSGAAVGRLVTDTAESRAVLATLNDFHRSWFPANDVVNGVFADAASGTNLLHDGGEAALHVTRALLTPGVPVSDLVTGDSGIEALRTNGPSTFQATDPAERLKQFNSLSNGSIVDLVAEKLQVGELIGARKISANTNKYNQTVNALGSFGVDNVDYFEMTSPTFIHRSLGGGILGSRAYLLLNLGRPDTMAANGGIRMNRRWSKTVFHDLLCRELPVLRVSDGVTFVQGTVSGATPAFRKSSSCMSCHATMDPMAGTARNLSISAIPYAYSANAEASRHIINWPVSKAAETGVVDDDPYYFQRPPNGILRYRSFTGALIEKPVNGIPALGAALAAEDDFYVCVAARYFKYFTGIGVNLQDIGDANNPSLGSGEIAYRDYVIDLGRSLKVSQNLKSLIQNILSSSIYRKSSMRDVGTP